jgi:hypothetical protein
MALGAALFEDGEDLIFEEGGALSESWESYGCEHQYVG